MYMSIAYTADDCWGVYTLTFPTLHCDSSDLQKKETKRMVIRKTLND